MKTLEEWKKYFSCDSFATGMGAELVELEPGRAVARMHVDERHLNAVGTVMGGAIFTLADFAFAAASNSHGTVAVASDVHISFVRAVTEGELIAEAVEVSRGKTLAHYDVRVRDAEGKIVALFHGTAFRKNEPLRRRCD
ncbi:MAG: PaaI family thioesterase [Candidatus Sumerlaeaceae bacterium]|nr:PaaI family thioesterase [Candidatus Sumerlaeaceae bacterium]